MKTGKELGLIAGHGRDINVMTFSPDGKIPCFSSVGQDSQDLGCSKAQGKNGL